MDLDEIFYIKGFYRKILIDTLQLQFLLFPVSGQVINMDLKIVVTLLSLACVKSQFFEDRRCRCVCPSPASVLNSTVTRQIYTGNVPPNQCNCEGVVFPLIRKELEGKLYLFCPRCECVYQTRNTTLIMGVVFIMLVTITLSGLYMLSLAWLKYLIIRNNERHQQRNYEHNERQRNPNIEEERLLISEELDN